MAAGYGHSATAENLFNRYQGLGARTNPLQAPLANNQLYYSSYVNSSQQESWNASTLLSGNLSR
jgi:hypothetical protein